MPRNTPELVKSAELWDLYMLQVLERGGMKVQTGTDDNGHAIVETIDIPPALLSAFERRLHHTGMSLSRPGDAGAGGTGLTTGERLEKLKSEGRLKLAGSGKLRPVSEKRDAATG